MVETNILLCNRRNDIALLRWSVTWYSFGPLFVCERPNHRQSALANGFPVHVEASKEAKRGKGEQKRGVRAASSLRTSLQFLATLTASVHLVVVLRPPIRLFEREEPGVTSSLHEKEKGRLFTERRTVGLWRVGAITTMPSSSSCPPGGRECKRRERSRTCVSATQQTLHQKKFLLQFSPFSSSFLASGDTQT